jgi:tetratricopeptide (TPR) repeat protein
MVGTRGSKKRGLLTLQRVADQGSFARDDARALLIVLLKREKRYEEALAIARALGEKYPRNYLFKLEAADALNSIASIERQAGRKAEMTKAEGEALVIFESLVHDRASREAAARSLDLIYLRYGEALLNAGQPENAAQEFVAAASVVGAEPELVTIAHLQAARSFDLAGKRADALAQYRTVLSRPDASGAHTEARQGLKEPYRLKNNGKNVSE